MKNKAIFLFFLCITFFALGAHATTTYYMCDETTSAPPPCAAVFASSYPGGVWTSSDPVIASVDASTGEITTHEPGNVVITYTLSGGACGDIVFSFVLIVNALPSITSLPLAVCVGSTGTLTASPPPPAGTWTSGNPIVATVDASTGVVTGVNAGTALMTYTNSTTGCYATTVVTVNALPLVISGLDFVCGGSTINLSSGPAGGTWTSSNPSVATVSPLGPVTVAVTGVSTGTTIITYTRNGCYRTKTVTVDAPTITGPTGVTVGSTVALTGLASGGTWSSSNPSVATISGSGVVTGVAVGTTTITYMRLTGCYATHVVTVCEPFETDICQIAPIHTCDDVISYCDNLKLAVYGGGAGYTYNWAATPYDLDLISTMSMDGDVAVFTFSSAPPSGTNTYTITVTNTSGCTSTTSVTIVVATSAACYPCGYFKPCVSECIGCDTVHSFKTIIANTLTSENISTVTPGNYYIPNTSLTGVGATITTLNVSPAEGSLFLMGTKVQLDVDTVVVLDSVHMFSPLPCGGWQGINLINSSTAIGQLHVTGNTLIEHADTAIGLYGSGTAYEPTSGNIIESDKAIYNLSKNDIVIYDYQRDTTDSTYAFRIVRSIFTARNLCGYFGESVPDHPTYDHYPFRWPTADYMKTPQVSETVNNNPAFNSDAFQAMSNVGQYGGIVLTFVGATSTPTATDELFYGVEIGDPNVVENTNMFDTIGAGIFVAGSNAKIYNNIFRRTGHVSTTMRYGVKATLADVAFDGLKRSVTLSHGASSWTNNRFYNCQYGFVGEGWYHLIADGCRATSDKPPVDPTGNISLHKNVAISNTNNSLSNYYFSKHIVTNNVTRGLYIAVEEYVSSAYNPNSEVVISNNNLTGISAMGIGTTQRGWRALEIKEILGSSTPGASLVVDNNFVSGFRDGIYYYGTHVNYAAFAASFTNNTVALLTDTSTNSEQRKGITSSYVKFLSAVTNNHIYGDVNNGVDFNSPGTVTHDSHYGIELFKTTNSATTRSLVSCNYVHDVAVGFRFRGYNEVDWTKNIMSRNSYGMMLYQDADHNSGQIGTQGDTCTPSDNVWYEGAAISGWPGWSSVSQTYTYGSDATLSKLYVRNITSSPYIFKPSEHNGSGISYTAYNIGTSILDISSLCSSVPAYDTCVDIPDEEGEGGGGEGGRPAPGRNGRYNGNAKEWNSYTVFPNPGDGNLTIQQANAVNTSVKVKVLDYAGAMVQKGTLTFKNGTSKLNVGKVAAGVYMVILTDDNGTTNTFRVVIQ